MEIFYECEIETNINFDNSSDIATVYTCNNKLINKLNELCEKHPNEYKLVSQDMISKTYEVSKRLITFRKPYDTSHWTPEKKLQFIEKMQGARK